MVELPIMAAVYGAMLLMAHASPVSLLTTDSPSSDVSSSLPACLPACVPSGQGASHGNSVSHRVLGSTGCRHDPGRVAKGKKMAGHMGAYINQQQEIPRENGHLFCFASLARQ